MVLHIYNLNYVGSVDRRIVVQGQPWEKKHKSLSEKQLKQKRAEGMPQVVECLPKQVQGLEFQPILEKEKKKRLAHT
jgi:hypothetical protein